MNKINFEKIGGLIPTIIQDNSTSEVYMLGYMNEQSLQKTITDGFVTFWSRSRNTFWTKGELSGNKLRVIGIFTDCDSDTLLVKVKLIGTNVCHTGERTCFNRKLSVRSLDFARDDKTKI